LVGLLLTSDQPDTKNFTWQHKTLIRDRHPCPRWDSNPKSKQAGPVPCLKDCVVTERQISEYYLKLRHYR
jgi:hypothetical protein